MASIGTGEHIRQGLTYKGKGKAKGKRGRKGKGKGRGHRYQGRMTGPFEEIRMVEMTKAINSLAVGKAAGPDGIPIELYQEIPAMRERLRGPLHN